MTIFEAAPTRLKFHAAVIPGQSPNNEDVSDQGLLPFIQGCAEFGDWHPTATKFCDVAPKVAEAGDVLISVRAPVGDLNIAEKSLGIGRGVAAVRVRPGFHSRFMYWLLSGSNQELRSHATGTTFEAVSATDIGNLPFKIGTQGEQERIANFLDDKTARIDALIAAKERLAESLKDIEEVTAFDMVTRGLSSNSKRTSFVEPWLGEVPLHWSLAKIRNIAIVGNGSTPKRDNEDYWVGGETPWLNSGSVNSPRIVDASDYVTPLAIKECHLPTVRAGSTVVALTGQGKTRGRAAFAEFETTINQHLAYISVVDQKVSDEYLWVALTGFYSVFRYISDGEGSTKGALTCEELNRFRLPVPPQEEQAAIVKAYLERIGAIELLECHNELHIARLREYRSSLISAAVTGQLEITG